MFLEFLSNFFDRILVFGPRNALEENATVTPCFSSSENQGVREARNLVLTQVLILCCQVSEPVEGMEAVI